MPFTTFETAIGPCALAWNDAGVTWMQLPEGTVEETIDRLLIFRLGRPDVLPVADLGVRKGFGNLFLNGAMPTIAQLERRAERWRPFRSVASWFMWRATEN